MVWKVVFARQKVTKAWFDDREFILTYLDFYPKYEDRKSSLLGTTYINAYVETSAMNLAEALQIEALLQKESDRISLDDLTEERSALGSYQKGRCTTEGAMPYYVMGSAETIDVAAEAKGEYNEMEVLFESEELDAAHGFIRILMNEPTSAIWKYKHIKILDESGVEKYFYFQYQWLPHNSWFQLNPPPDRIRSIVRTRGEHVQPSLLSVIDAYRKRAA